jgi:hypothetical protein
MDQRNRPLLPPRPTCTRHAAAQYRDPARGGRAPGGPVRQLRAARPARASSDSLSMTESLPTPVVVAGSAHWRRDTHRALLLSWLSPGYMTAEGAVAVTAALLAHSVALLGFGLDSAIEGLASVIVVKPVTCRLTAGRSTSTAVSRGARYSPRCACEPSYAQRRLKLDDRVIDSLSTVDSQVGSAAQRWTRRSPTVRRPSSAPRERSRSSGSAGDVNEQWITAVVAEVDRRGGRGRVERSGNKKEIIASTRAVQAAVQRYWRLRVRPGEPTFRRIRLRSRR